VLTRVEGAAGAARRAADICWWIPEAGADSPGMIFAAPPPRANMDSFETTIAVAATVKDHFWDFFMTRPRQAEGRGSDLKPRGSFRVNVFVWHGHHASKPLFHCSFIACHPKVCPAHCAVR